jgi:hypothetical protein
VINIRMWLDQTFTLRFAAADNPSLTWLSHHAHEMAQVCHALAPHLGEDATPVNLRAIAKEAEHATIRQAKGAVRIEPGQWAEVRIGNVIRQDWVPL